MAVILTFAAVAGLSGGWSGSPAGASPAQSACVTPAQVYFPMVFASAESGDQICGIENLENEIYETYATLHGLSLNDPNVIDGGQYDMEGMLWQDLAWIANTEDSDPSSLTTVDQDAYGWLQTIVTASERGAADDAYSEYQKWASDPCGYEPPNTSIFSFDAAADPACGGTLGALFAGPTPPTYQDFIEYGEYDAAQNFQDDSPYAQSTFQELVNQGMLTGASVFTGLVSAPTALVNSLGLGESLLDKVAPFSKELNIRQWSLFKEEVQKALKTLQDNIDAGTVEDEELLDLPIDELLEANATDLVDAADLLGIDAPELFSTLGALAATGPLLIIGFAVALLAQEISQIVSESQLPGQLQSNENNIQSDIGSLVSTSNGYQEVYGDFESQLTPGAVDPAVGTGSNVVNQPPSDGTQFGETFVNNQGQPVYSQDVPSLSIPSWPLGVDMGQQVFADDPTVRQPPLETIAMDDGTLWHTPDGDQSAAGLSGYLPSGEIHYFNWNGQPEVAIIQGDEFLNVPSGGSVDMGGADTSGASDGSCGDCYLTGSIDTLLPATYTVNTSNGSIYPTNAIPIELTIVPDKGAAPGVNIYNQWNAPANDLRDGSPDGGLIAGQTVQFNDPEVNALGYAETYTWQIQSLCPYNPDPSEQPETIQGVPVCYGNPDYGQSSLAPDEQDLTSGCPSACTEDPDFNGEPVTTLTGQTVSYTWPAPGTYHVRLITDDQYGHQQQSDLNVTIVGPTGGSSPGLTMQLGSVSPGYAGASVLGPVDNGQLLSFSGCILSSDVDYIDPTVSIDWGDGSTTDPTAVFGSPTTSCPSPWSFSASHTYGVTPNGSFQQQLPLSLSVSDGLGDTTPLDLYVDVDTPAAPTFTSADSTTVTAGGSGYFEISAQGDPTPTLSLNPALLPAPLEVATLGSGNLAIEGVPTAADAGTYLLPVEASNDVGTATEDVQYTITAAPTFTSAPSGEISAGNHGQFTITTAGYPTPQVSIAGVSGSGTSLPSSLSFVSNSDGTATLSGTPTSGDAGTYDITLDATSASGSATQQFVLTIGSAPLITSSSTAGFVDGESSIFTVTATGYPQPALQLSGSLPTGLYFSDTGGGTGEIFGSTSATGTFPVTVTATNVAGSASQTLDVNVSSTGGPAITFSGPNFSSAEQRSSFEVGQSGSITVTSSDGTDISLNGGSLPSGLTFTDEGDGTATISGTPDAGTGGIYDYYFTTPDDGLSFLALYVFGPPTVTSPSTATFTAGQAGSFTVTTSSATTPVLSETGSLPDGLTFTDNGDGTATISGTPAADAAGTASIDVTAENLLASTTTSLSIVVDAAPQFTSPDSIVLGEGVAGSATVTTSGYPTASLSESGSLPPGLTFTDDGNGTATISGTPTDTTDLSYPVTFTATSPAGTTSENVTIEVGPLPTITTPALAPFSVGQDGAFTVDTQGLPVPSLSESGTLPGGLTFTDNGDGTATIAGTPATGAGGAPTVDVTATNKFGSVTQQLVVSVDEAPSFTGTGISSCAGTEGPDSNVASFVAGIKNGWLLCASGYPAPAMTLSGALPSGVTFTDDGGGSATIAGSPDDGTGGTYNLTLTMASPAGTATEALTLVVTEQVQSLTWPDAPTFTAGQPNTYTMRATGDPLPSFTVIGTGPPSWVSFTDNGNGTATISGTPPTSDAGTQVSFEVYESNGVGNGFVSNVSLTVTSLSFTAASPPSATAGTPYDYPFSANDPSATFSLAPGSALPAGLALSPAGVLSGVPKEVGSFNLSVVATDGGGEITSPPIALAVAPAPHELEITKFRLIGPNGPDDYFAVISNTMPFTVALSGWTVGVGIGNGIDSISLGTGRLLAHRSVVVSGPFYSQLDQVHPVAVGPPGVASPDGFEVVAPDGTVTDAAGEAGAPAGLFDGTGVTAPTGAAEAAQDAFARRQSGGQYVDTGDNAADFVFQPLANPQAVVFTSTPPAPALVGDTYDVSATGGGSGNPVAVTVRPASAAVCTISGDVVTFNATGWCAIEASQAGGGGYSAAPSVVQSVLVKLPQAVAFTSSAPVEPQVGATYAPSATGGASANPVRFSIARTSEGVCTVTGGVVHFDRPGTCTVDATQAGSTTYAAAPTVTQSIPVVTS